MVQFPIILKLLKIQNNLILNDQAIMSQSNTLSALNLSVIAQSSTLTQLQKVQCFSQDHTLMLALPNIPGTTLSLYQILNKEIIAKNITISDTFNFYQCVILKSEPSIEIYVLTKQSEQSKIYSIKIESPINQHDPNITKNSEDDPIKSIGVSPQGQLIEVSSSMIRDQNKTLQIQYNTSAGSNYSNPNVLILDQPDQYYLVDKQILSNPFLLKCESQNKTCTSTYVQLQSLQQFDPNQALQTTPSGNIIGIRFINSVGVSTRQLFMNRNLSVIQSNLGQHRFIKFSGATDKMIEFFSNQACLASYNLSSDNLSISTSKQICYPASSIDMFQEIYSDIDFHYFANGSTIFHFVNTSDSIQDPQIHFPNQYCQDTLSQVTNESKYFSLGNGQIIIHNQKAVYLSKLQTQEVQVIDETEMNFTVLMAIILCSSFLLIILLFILILCIRKCLKKTSKQSSEGSISTKTNKPLAISPKPTRSQMPKRNEPMSQPQTNFIPSIECCKCQEGATQIKLRCNHYFHKKCLLQEIKAKGLRKKKHSKLRLESKQYLECPQCHIENILNRTLTRNLSS